MQPVKTMHPRPSLPPNTPLRCRGPGGHVDPADRGDAVRAVPFHTFELALPPPSATQRGFLRTGPGHPLKKPHPPSAKNGGLRLAPSGLPRGGFLFCRSTTHPLCTTVWPRPPFRCLPFSKVCSAKCAFDSLTHGAGSPSCTAPFPLCGTRAAGSRGVRGQ
jgi:hypothetical protein